MDLEDSAAVDELENKLVEAEVTIRRLTHEQQELLAKLEYMEPEKFAARYARAETLRAEALEAAQAALRAGLQQLREKFDALLIAEVNAYGGIPRFAGRCQREQNEFREAVAELLADRLPGPDPAAER